MIDNVASAASSIDREMRSAKSSLRDACGSVPGQLRKLGSFSGRNNSRDFERAMKLPVVGEPVYIETTLKKKEDSLDEVTVKEDLDGSHIPVTIYGDTARYGTGFDQSKVTGCFLSLVLWRPKSTRMSQFLLWNLNGERSLGWKSHNPLYLAVVNSMNKAFEGFTWEGAQLNRKFCVTQIKGDWEYHWQTWRLRRYYKTRFICWRCDAENHADAAHSMTDVSEHPTWQATELSHNQFVVEGMQDNHVCA
ncbi:unnamed protein product [Symbiodinium necroappetens]|uniref:Uncharacterized protein n=1 Tax=Symbiodinium necroappetens TaxID=1628268 RepID=A0A812Z0E3_9DINO|nr:unnamed protein product [Symbiodinium necroappetens]